MKQRPDFSMSRLDIILIHLIGSDPLCALDW